MPKVKKITNIDRDSAEIIGNKARQSLIDSLKSMGISVKQKSGMIYPDKLTLKFEFFVPEVKEKVQKNDFLRLCASYGLKPTDLNKKFKLRTKTLKIIGISPRRRVKPIDVVDQNGKRFIMKTADAVKLLKTNPVK